VTAIHKSILFHRMAVQITKKYDIADLLNAQYQFFEIEYFRVVNLGRVFPLFVEIVARNVGAIVAVNDAIGVQHGNYLENEALPQSLGLGIGGKEKLDDAVADI